MNWLEQLNMMCHKHRAMKASPPNVDGKNGLTENSQNEKKGTAPKFSKREKRGGDKILEKTFSGRRKDNPRSVRPRKTNI